MAVEKYGEEAAAHTAHGPAFHPCSPNGAGLRRADCLAGCISLQPHSSPHLISSDYPEDLSPERIRNIEIPSTEWSVDNKWMSPHILP